MLLKLVVTAKEREGKLTGQKYLAFSTVKRDGSKVALKFRRDVEGLPKKAGKYEMEIESTTMNMSDRDGYEVWWVSDSPASIKDYIPEDIAKDQF